MTGNARLMRASENWARQRAIGLYWHYLCWRAARDYWRRRH